MDWCLKKKKKNQKDMLDILIKKKKKEEYSFTKYQEARTISLFKK
jgi:hypothetical protein